MDPLSIANMASGGLGMMGGLFSGIMSMNADNAHAKALNYAALQADQQAGVNAQEALQQGDQAAAHGAVQAAANGGGFTGSSIGLISQLSNQAMFNARAQVYRGQSEAQNDLYEAKVAKQAGTDALIGGVVGAGAAGTSGWARNAFDHSIISDRPGGYGYGYGYGGGPY